MKGFTNQQQIIAPPYNNLRYAQNQRLYDCMFIFLLLYISFCKNLHFFLVGNCGLCYHLAEGFLNIISITFESGCFFMQKYIKLGTKYGLLIRLVLTLMLTLLIPTMLFFLVVVDSSYKKMIANNNKYFANTTDLFSRYFDEELNRLHIMALRLADVSRSTEIATFSEERLSENPYYYLDVLQYLSKFNPNPSLENNIYLYYKNIGHIYNARHKYDVEGFIRASTAGNEALAKKYRDFFALQPEENITFFSTFDSEDSKSAVFYVGFPVKIGTSYTDAMVFFTFNYNSIYPGMFAAQNPGALQLYIYNGNSLLFTSADKREPFLAEPAFFEFLNDDARMSGSVKYDGASLALFKTILPGSTQKFVSVLPREYIETDTMNFFAIIRLAASLVVIVLLGMSALAVYINYIPIARLVKRAAGDTAGSNAVAGAASRGSAKLTGELGVIEDAITRLETELIDKDVLIMDGLIKNLLYNVPIPNDRLKEMGMLDNAGAYCVMTLTGTKLDLAECKRLAADIKASGDAAVYITDMLYEEHTVIICFINEGKENVIAERVREGIRAVTGREFVLHMGSVVTSQNDIRQSYVKCLKAMNQKPKPIKQTEQPQNEKEALKQNILAYVSEHLSDPSLNQAEVADNFGLSVYSLSRFFKEHIGIGFSEYITAMRIDNAKNLLITTQLSVASVAAQVGMSNANYFSRLFKTHCGTTPLAFRGMMKE